MLTGYAPQLCDMSTPVTDVPATESNTSAVTQPGRRQLIPHL